jgi:hypothetical protein
LIANNFTSRLQRLAEIKRAAAPPPSAEQIEEAERIEADIASLRSQLTSAVKAKSDEC